MHAGPSKEGVTQMHKRIRQKVIHTRSGVEDPAPTGKLTTVLEGYRHTTMLPSPASYSVKSDGWSPPTVEVPHIARAV